MTKIPNSAILMAAAHILTTSEHTGTGSDIHDSWGTYRTSRLKEVSRLAFDLAGEVEHEAHERGRT